MCTHQCTTSTATVQHYTDEDLLCPKTQSDIYADLNHPLFGEDTHFVRFYVFGDGNCFFHTIAFLLNFNNYRYVTNSKFQQHLGNVLRKQIVRRSQWNRFLDMTGFTDVAPSYETVVSRTYYADDFVYNFVSRRIGMAIVVLSSMTEIFSTHNLSTLDPTYPILLIAWLQNVHFEPIVQVHKQTVEQRGMWAAHDNSLCRDASSTHMQAIFVCTDPIVQRVIRIQAQNRRPT